jgi:hypothetical protein
MARLQQVPEGTGKKRTSPLTGAESIQIESGNGVRDAKVITDRPQKKDQIVIQGTS